MFKTVLYKTRLVVVLAAGLAVTTGCLADLRPAAVKSRIVAGNAEQAMLYLRQAANKTHRQNTGFNTWHAQAGVGLQMQDEWFGFLGWVILPYKMNPQSSYTRFVPGKDNSIVEFQNKDKKLTGAAWGIHDWNVWHHEAGKTAVYEDAHDIHFLLPTLQYFVEMVYRLPQGQAIRDYAGEQTIDGKTYHVIYMTWGSYPPNDMNDQYVAYINKANSRLERVDFTVRDKAGFVSDTVVYGDFKQVGDFILPHLISIGSKNIKESGLHSYKIESYHLNLPLKKADYAPRSELSKKSKY